jgi:hypothetical protein
MSKLVSRCVVEVNGKPVDFFKNFKENAREIRKWIKLMGKRRSLDVTPDILFSLDLVKAKKKWATAIDWENFEDGTVTVRLEGGETVTFINAAVASVGEWTTDDENEIVQTIAFGAEDRRTE